MPRSPSVRSLIKHLEPDELREVIVELSMLSPKNKQFLKLYLQSSDAVDVESVVDEAKKKIHGHFYGRGIFPNVNLSAARKTVNEYSKILKDYPGPVADLKLYYVEVGTALTNEFGDMDDRFYSSLVSMFKAFCKQVKAHPACYKQLQGRIDALMSDCQDIGWGYSYVITEFICELQDTIPIDQ
jgi:hypothetical protein